MQLNYISALALAAMLATPALACKCYDGNGSVNQGKTKSCCNQLHGVYRNGNDCAASSISEHLSQFRRCCGGRSDCDYPGNAEIEAKVDDGSAETGTTVIV